MAEEGAAGDLGESGVVADLEAAAAAGRGAARDPALMQRAMGHIGKVGEQARAFFATKTKHEVYVEGQGRGFLIGAANDARDLVESEQLSARNWFVDLPHPELGKTIKFPGLPYHLTDTPPRLRRRAPLLGEHNTEVYTSLGLSEGDITALKEGGLI